MNRNFFFYCLLIATLALTTAAKKDGEGTKNVGQNDLEIEQLLVQPSPLVFFSLKEDRRILVTGIATTGEKVDLSSSARLTPLDDVVSIGKDRFLHAAKIGGGLLRVEASGHTVNLPIRVDGALEDREPSFLRDVVPVLNRVGCTAGTCHGSAKGKSGFKLSLRGYDPEFDYQALLYDMSGRRFNRADPARSLMLAKPTQQVAHGGGLQLEIGTRYYDTLLDWISSGVPFGNAKEDGVARLEVLPAEIFMHQPGRRQSVMVLAHYADGSTRDVTREAHIASSNVEDFSISESAEITGVRRGEGALLVRYEGKFVTIPITVLNPALGFEWVKLPQYNYIDRLVDSKLQRLKIQPSPPAADDEFLRRLFLDLTGQLPQPETVRAFIADSSAPQKKREQIIDQLIGSEGYVDHWSLKWGDLLRINRKFLGDKAMWRFREWLRQSISENKPYDDLVEELLTSKGSSVEEPAANFFRVARNPKEAMETTTQLFLGVRMVCSQCHDHPFEKWTQQQYFEMAAFFGSVGIKPGFRSGEEIVYEKRFANEVMHPKTGRPVRAQYLVPSSHAPPIPEGDSRAALAEWLTSKDNAFFARAVANRIWSYFFGRGIIEPVDDIRASNPPINEALLDALAKDLTEHDFDLRHLIRTIVESRTYQASFQTNEWSKADYINFSHHWPRRLTAEQLADAIAMATGSSFDFPTVPKDFRASQLPDPHVGRGGFLDLFGRPQREQPCECERRSEMSLPQALNLVNGSTLAQAVADPEGRVSTLIVSGANDQKLVEELYLATLSRFPTAAENELAEKVLNQADSRAQAGQDLLWALLNSNGFLFNR